MVRPRRRGPAAATLAAALGIFVVAWTFTGEIAAATGTVSSSRAYGRTLGHPFTWVDDGTKLNPTLYVGEGESDQNPEWMLEFWNRSIERVTSLDGSVQGPGPAGGPNLDRKGTLLWGDGNPTYDYAVEDLCIPVLPGESQWPCVDLLGTPAGSHTYTAGGTLRREWRLVRLAHPNRLKAMATGIAADGWTGPSDSAYFRFAGTERWLRVVVSRRAWGGASGPSPVHVILGTLTINSNEQPILSRVTKQVDTSIDSTQTQIVWLRVPAGPFAVHVVVDKKFVPNDYPPHSGDVRQLGAEVEYRLFAKKP
jgi:hypothetical protein